MTFFYDLNKKLDEIRATPSKTHGQLNERDMSRAAKGYEKYGKEGMEALAKAGREGKDLDKVRAKYDKYDNTEVDEGLGNIVKKVGGAAKKLGSKALDTLGHGSDADMIRDLQKRMGVPQTGKKPEQKTDEAAKYRDPKYKDKLYTVEPLDYTYGPDADELYYNPKPDDYEGRKRKIGGGEFDHNDPLRKGFGRGGSGSPVEKGPRKGLPSRNQITSLKGSIKDAHGTHTAPNLPEAGAPMTAKQKSFAKLAPPVDKITFADKIAGAKKEVDEMLGDVAAEAMKSALGGGRGRSSEMDEGWDDMMADVKRRAGDNSGMRVGDRAKTSKGEIEKTATGIRHTRAYDAKTGETNTGDDGAASAEKRSRGRPKGTSNRTGAKGPSGRSKLMTREDNHESDEIKQAMAMLKKAGYKISKDGEQELDEKAVSKKQQKFMGMVHATQKGEKAPSKEVAKVAKSMGKKDAEDFASTKHKGLPEKKKSEGKKKEKEVDESSTTAGSVAPAAGGKGSMSFGKGIYDSMNRELESMIAESMSINMSSSTEGGSSLTVTATEEDAAKLAEILKMAGIGGGQDRGHDHGEEACPTCNQAPCGCSDMVDENSPDYPTNTEQADNNFEYSGGLNKPKSTGQSTVPVLASQEERQHSYAAEEEDAIKRMMEMAGVKKKEVDEEKTDEGNKFTGNLAKARAAGKKEADLDGDGDMEKVRESVAGLWKEYKGKHGV
jgi:hypothetical protein